MELKNYKYNITLKYNEKKYGICSTQNKPFALRRLSDGKTLKEFDCNIDFIYEIDYENEAHFMVSEAYDDKTILTEYVDNGWDTLVTLNTFKVNCNSLDFLKVNNQTFIVEQSELDHSACLYNYKAGKSIRFDHIYADECINEEINNEIVFVNRTIKSLINPNVIDTITYGINPYDFSIITSIWSETQHKIINTYKNDTYGELTIKLEIQKHLNELAKKMPEPENIYNDLLQNIINKNFIKKLTNK